jgi:hypothetical protein
MISTDDPTRGRADWRRRRRLPLAAILTWSLLAVGLGWLLLSALVGFSSIS